jgi:Leucine-rich repeat (LRR) protein
MHSLQLDYALLAPPPPAPWTTGPDLAAYPHLQALSITGHALEDLDWLAPCPHLQQLDASHNLLADVQGLRHTPHLHTLLLAHNDLRSLDTLPALPQLRTLSLSGNRALQCGWAGLPINAPRIKHLYLKQIGLPSFDFLVKLVQLEALYLSVQDVATLAPLLQLPHLHTLHLHARSCTTVAQFPLLPQLRHLTLTGAVALQDVSPLTGLTGLTHLSLSATGVVAPECLFALPRLQQLDLRGTPAAQRPDLSPPSHLHVLR